MINQLAKQNSMNLTDAETISYVGGARLSAAFLTQLVKLAKMLYGWGQEIGKIIRSSYVPYIC